MRYGKAKTDAVASELGVMEGVAGFEASGVGGRKESVADKAGDGMVTLCGVEGIAIRGEGEIMGDVEIDGGVGFVEELAEVSVGRCLGSAISMFTDLSEPLSTTIVLGSAENSPSVTPERNSYSRGENLTATLAFLCPGSRAIGGRAKLAREYM